MKIYISAAATLALGVGSPALAQKMDDSMREGHGREAMPAGQDPHTGHGAHGASSHEGYAMQAHDAHAGHDMASHGGTAIVDPPKKPADAIAFSGPAHAADLFYDPSEMTKVRTNIMRAHGEMTVAKLMIDRLEVNLGDGPDGYAWEADAWIGKDINKLWIKSEGEGSFGEAPEHAEVQALWSHAIDPWFDLQMGVRQDFQPHPQRTHAVLAIQGLAPYWFEISGEAFISDKGDVTARAEAEYDLRITNRAILQPRLELNLSGQKIPEIGLGSGMTDASLGLRLRYEFSPQFAPYFGAQWEQSFGATKRYARIKGEDSSRFMLVLGTRFWF